MSEETGFSTMVGAKAESEVPEIGVGMLGYAFMGKAHTNAYKKIPYMMYPPPMIPKLVALCGRNEEAVTEAALRYGYEGYYTDWQKMLENDEIQLFDNGGPNDSHADPCIMAAKRGMHILCEKPLARNAEEAKKMLDAVQKARIKHMVAFNYRFVPAIRQIRNLIDSGKLVRGIIQRFRRAVITRDDAITVFRFLYSIRSSGIFTKHFRWCYFNHGRNISRVVQIGIQFA